jgi:hypothetical protein
MMHLAHPVPAAIAISALLAAAVPALAWDHDRVFADSFGNLVIISASGYKRILVGEGHEAGRLAEYTSAGQPTVVVADDSGGAAVEDCFRPPALVKGRSYMYGFDEGEIPFQGGPCR